MRYRVGYCVCLALLLVLSGCVSWIVPKTVISGSIGGQPFSYSGPKDQTVGLLRITATTNGTISITVSNLSARMNPDVITTSAAAQVDLINALSAAIQQAMLSGAGYPGTVRK